VAPQRRGAREVNKEVAICGDDLLEHFIDLKHMVVAWFAMSDNATRNLLGSSSSRRRAPAPWRRSLMMF
jgi:hypothetical protein